MNSISSVVRNPIVGDVLHSSWGYDQTNASFYLVTKVTGARVTLQELQNIETPSKESWMFGTAVPNMTDFKGSPVVKGFSAYGEGYRVKVTSYASAYLWNGSPQEVSHTH